MLCNVWCVCVLCALCSVLCALCCVLCALRLVLCVQELTVAEWDDQLKHVAQRDRQTNISDSELGLIRQEKEKTAANAYNVMLWFSDMSFRLTSMKAVRVYLATKVPAHALEQKKYYETIEINSRKLCGSVPFVINCGKVVHAVAYEREVCSLSVCVSLSLSMSLSVSLSLSLTLIILASLLTLIILHHCYSPHPCITAGHSLFAWRRGNRRRA
jgi:hypothetical protein